MYPGLQGVGSLNTGLCKCQDKRHAWTLREVPTASHRSTDPSHHKGIRRSRMARSSLPPCPLSLLLSIGRNLTVLPDLSHPASSSKDYSKHFSSSTCGRSFWNHPVPPEVSVGAVAPSSPSLHSMELLGSTVPAPKTRPGSYLSSPSRPSF